MSAIKKTPLKSESVGWSIGKEDFSAALDEMIQREVKNFDTKVAFKKEHSAVRRRRPRGKKEKKDRRLFIPAIAVVTSVRKGISFDKFYFYYKNLSLTNKKWAEILGVSEKTIQTIVKNKRSLDANKSEKLIAFLLLVRYGIEVFGSIESFKEWLLYKTPVLKNKAPFDFLDTTQGISMLKEQIFKIETGNLI